MMKSLFRLWLVFPFLLIVACTQQDDLPTLVPTDPAPTITATFTPSPSPEPTNTPAPPTATPNIPQTEAERPSQQSFMRYIHAAPDYGSVVISVDDLVVTGRLDYARASGQGGITAGTYTVTVANAEDPAQIILQQDVNIVESTAHIFVFTGTQETPALAALVEDTTPMNAGESRIAVYNAIPRGPVIQIEGDESSLTTPLGIWQCIGTCHCAGRVTNTRYSKQWAIPSNT